MKKFQLTSFIDSTYIITLEKENDKSNYDFLLKTFNKSHIKKIKTYSKNYFDLIISNSSDNYSKKTLIEWRNRLEKKFLFDIYKEVRFSPLYSSEKNDPELIDVAIMEAVHKLFFYSDLTLAGLIGNIENYTNRVKKSGSLVHHLSKLNIELYKEVWLKITELNEKVPGIYARRACINVSNKHPENIEDYENENRLYKRFHSFMKRHQIESIQDYINFLSTNGL